MSQKQENETGDSKEELDVNHLLSLNHYEILGVSANADKTELKKAHKKSALKYHPDRWINTGDKERAEEIFKKIQEAFETLNDEEKKEKYHADLSTDNYDEATFFKAKGDLLSGKRKSEEVQRLFDAYIEEYNNHLLNSGYSKNRRYKNKTYSFDNCQRTISQLLQKSLRNQKIKRHRFNKKALKEYDDTLRDESNHKLMADYLNYIFENSNKSIKLCDVVSEVKSMVLTNDDNKSNIELDINQINNVFSSSKLRSISVNDFVKIENEMKMLLDVPINELCNIDICNGYLSMVNKYQIMIEEQNKNDYKFIGDIKKAESKTKILTLNQSMKRISNVKKISDYVSKLTFDIKKSPDWISNESCNVCMNRNCDVKFNLFNRRHHCRVCGGLFCSTCITERKCVQFGFNKATKICDKCYQDSCIGFLVDMLINDIKNVINKPDSSDKVINNLSMIRSLINHGNLSVQSINIKISMILKGYVEDDCKNDTDEKQSLIDDVKDAKTVSILLDFVNNSKSIIWVNYVRKLFELKRWNHFVYAVLYSNKRGFVNWTKIVDERISTDKYFAYGLLACEKLFTMSNYVSLMQKYMDQNTKSREGLLILVTMQYLTRNNMKQKYLQIAMDYMKKKHVAKAMLFYYCSGISRDEWIGKIMDLTNDKQIKKMVIFCNVIDKCVGNDKTRNKCAGFVAERTKFVISLHNIYKDYHMKKLNTKEIESQIETLLQSFIATKKTETFESFMNYCVLLKLVNKNSDIVECIEQIMLKEIKKKHLFVGLVYLKMLMKLYKSYYCDHNTHLKVLEKINGAYTDESSLFDYLKYSIAVMGITKEQLKQLNKMEGSLISMIINLQQRDYKKCIVNGVKRLFDIKTMSKMVIQQTEMTTLMRIWMKMCKSLIESGQDELCVVGLSAVIRYKFDSQQIDKLPITLQMMCSLLNTIYTNLEIKDNDNLYTYQWIASLHQTLRELIMKKDTSIKDQNDKMLLLFGCKQVCSLCDNSYQINKSDELLIINCMKHKLEKAYYNLWYNQLFELFYEHIADFNMSDLLASTKWLIEKYLQDNIEDNPEQFQSFWYLLHALLHRFSYGTEDDEKQKSGDELCNLDKASEYLQKALTKNIHDVPQVIGKILEVDTFWQSYLYDTHIIGFIQDVDAINIEVPKIQHFETYLKRLQSISQLKTITLFEKYLLKRCADKNTHETALLYIDLGDIVEGISSYLDSQLLACLWIIESMKNSKDDPSKIYAYQKILNEKLFGFYSLLLKGVCTPILRTQYFKAVLYCWVKCCYLCESLDEHILSQINDDRLELLFASEEIWKVTINSILQLGRVCILPNLPIITSACDTLFFQMFSTKVVSKYLTLRTQTERKTQLGTQLYCNYYLFEGMWKGWNGNADEKNDDGRLHSDLFYETRLHLMDRILENKQWNVEDIEHLLKWSIIKRDENGFMTNSKRIFQLNLTSKNGKYYRSFDGITVDFKNGSIQLQLKEATNVKDRLFTMNDIKSIFKMQLSSAFFSLDQVMAKENTSDPSFYYNPFQQFRFGPNRLIHSDYMATMFFTDYILKMITQSTEISSKIPFKQRKAFDNGFMSVLPQYLKEALNLQNYRKMEIEMEKEKNKLNSDDEKNKDSLLEKLRGRAHRFWIEGDEIQYSMNHNKNTDKIVYKFGNVDMKIKKHLLEMNENGELVDAKIDDNDMSAEGLFAKAFTQNYDQFAHYFPIFNRLKELLKICGAYRILQGKYDTLKEIKGKVNYSDIYNRIDQVLNDMRNRVISNLDYWPINSSSHVSKLMDDTLSQNGVSRSQVQWSELNRVERDIQNSLNTAQTNSINQLFDAICDGFELSKYSYSNIKDNIYQWISNGRNNTWKSNDYARQNIASAVANKRYNDEMTPINNMLSQLSSFGFSHKINEKDSKNKNSNIDSMVHYVPAVFTDLAKINEEKELQYQVYGGVSMNANLRIVNRVNVGPGTGINRHVNLATINSHGGASRPNFGRTLANGLGIGAQDAVRYMNQSGGGRTGKQARLRQMANDPKLGRAQRGWIQQEINSINRKSRNQRGNPRRNIRNPPGYELAHHRGREAAKGYSYQYSELNTISNHRLQHKYDDYGRKNKERSPIY